MVVDESEEILPVVDANDEVVGMARRREIHARNLRHRSAHVLVFNGAGELLIQKRSASKDEFPLAWDLSVGGHVGPGETYEQTARRELDEELGLKCDTLTFLRKTPATGQTGWEFTCLYILTTDQPIRPNRREIEECRFIAPETLAADVRTGRYAATPALRDALAFYLTLEAEVRDS